MSRLHIADTGLFAAMGQPSNSRYQAIRRFARWNDVTFVLPERVYEELTVDDPGIEDIPVDAASDEGWATVASPPAFSKPIVSRVMDGVQRYIANADDRPADEIEQADAALAALAKALKPHSQARGTVTQPVTFVNGFLFIEDLRSTGYERVKLANLCGLV